MDFRETWLLRAASLASEALDRKRELRGSADLVGSNWHRGCVDVAPGNTTPGSSHGSHEATRRTGSPYIGVVGGLDADGGPSDPDRQSLER